MGFHRAQFWSAVVNIYINDFPGSIDIDSDVIMFADDTSILISNSDYDELN